ncbi:MAB_1171c family putative transporter [Streptomyces sp. NPDC006487]|uniref:MAB_1171c family putative transporter n=1 Tax=Streptomyces sp. NPDC006487 TaxID=3364748 RepID=UPI0036BE446D
MRLFDIVVVPPLWLFALWKLPHLKSASRRDRVLWTMWMLWAVLFTIGVPAVRTVLDAAVGMEGFAKLPVHMLGLCAMTAFVEFIREATGARRNSKAWLRWVLLGLAEAGLVTAFFASPLPEGDADLVTRTDLPQMQVYWAIFLAYIGHGVVRKIHLCWRYGRQASPGPSRTSMNLLGLASCFGLLYVVHRLVYLVAAVAGATSTAGFFATSQTLLACTLVLFLASMAYPSLAGAAKRHRLRKDRRVLRPLWELLTAVTPEVVLPLPEVLSRDHEFVRYRYVIEIRDAALAVSGHVRPEQEARVQEELTGTGLAGSALDAASEAALVLFAVESERAGAAPSAAEHPLLREGPDIDAEMAWMRRVAAAMSTPAVEAAVGRLR